MFHQQSPAIRQLTRQRVDFIRRSVSQRLEVAAEEILVTTRMVPASNMWEVSLAGRLVHSRKRGDGYVDSGAKINKIVRALALLSPSQI